MKIKYEFHQKCFFLPRIPRFLACFQTQMISVCDRLKRPDQPVTQDCWNVHFLCIFLMQSSATRTWPGLKQKGRKNAAAAALCKCPPSDHSSATITLHPLLLSPVKCNLFPGRFGPVKSRNHLKMPFQGLLCFFSCSDQIAAAGRVWKWDLFS